MLYMFIMSHEFIYLLLKMRILLHCLQNLLHVGFWQFSIIIQCLAKLSSQAPVLPLKFGSGSIDIEGRCEV